MNVGAATLVGLALSAGTAHPAPPAAGALVCTKYRVIADKNALVPEENVAAWATAALEKAALFDKASPCYVHVRITAAPLRKGGQEDGWVAHVSLSTRRYVKDGKIVTNEKGMLLIDARREDLVARVQSFVEEYVSKPGKALQDQQTSDFGSDRG